VKFLLDTNTVSYYLRAIPATLAHVQASKPSDLAISAITVMELTYGIEKRKSKDITAAVRHIIAAMQVLPYDQDAAERTGSLRAVLESKGIALATPALEIAGHALATGLILVTSDAAFSRVKGLVVKDWAKP
jgi:tRNA(fMet)-specific endonuclease VapC